MVISSIGRFLKQLVFGGRAVRIDGSSKLIRLGRDEYKYVDGDRSLVLFIELLTGKPELAIHSSSIDEWLPPHKDEKISEGERQQIAGRIARSLERHGYSVMIQ